MSLGDGAKPSMRSRAFRSARLAVRSRVIDERRLEMASTNEGLSASEATERRRTRLYVACWRIKTHIERLLHPISTASLPLDLATLGDRGTWDEVRGGITIVPKVPPTSGGRRGSEVDREGTVVGSEVDSEASAAEAGTDSGGVLPSSDFIV